MRLAGRVLAILAVIAGLVFAGPTAAQATQNCTLTRTGDVYCSGAAAPVRIPVTGKVVQLAAGVGLVIFSRPQGAASRAASRNLSAPSLSRSV